LTEQSTKFRAPLVLLELNEANRELMSRAGETLKLAHLNRILGFHETSPTKLFYRLEFTDDVQPPATFEFDGKTDDFFEHFERVVLRTGKHCPDGFVIQDHRIMPERIENHQICEYICRHFGLPVEPAVESADIAPVKRV